MRQLFRKGQRIDAVDALNSILPATLRSIYAGPGIKILPNGAGISISAIAQPRRGGGGASSGSDVQTAKVKDLNADKNSINCYAWDYGTGAWSTTEIQVFKPFIMMHSTYNEKTIPYTGGVERYYDAVGLPAEYSRRATWTESSVEYTEIQQITSLYYPGELIQIEQIYIPDAQRTDWGLPAREEGESPVYWIDKNNAGRHWAAIDNEAVEEGA